MGRAGRLPELPLDCVSVILEGHFNAFFHLRIYLCTDSYQALAASDRLPRGKFPVCPYKASLHRLLFV